MRLPLYTIPPVICFQDRAFPLCILMGNYQGDIDKWFCSHYFHACYNAKTGENFDLFHEDKWFTREGALIERIISPTDKLEIRTIVDLLDEGYYIYGKWDEYYVPGKGSYKDHHNEHDYLLYGYDEMSKAFDSLGYLQNGGFIPFTVNYDNYYKSISSLPMDHLYLRAYKYNPDYECAFSMESFKKILSDYLNGTNLFSYINVDQYPFGIETWAQLASFFTESVEREEDLDIRYSRCYWEYKVLMSRRMNYLSRNSLIPELVAQQYSEIEQRAHRFFLLSIKYNLTQKHDVFLRMLEEIHISQERERVTLATALTVL